MATLATTVDGLNLPNPFLIAAGPPGTNLNVIQRAFREKWGGVIAKTISLDASKVVNVTPRYGKLYSNDRSEIFGWENIELISDRPFEIWLEEFKRCKDQNPDGVLIASIMEEYRRDAWIEIVERCQEAGVDGVRAELLLPARLARTQDGLSHGRRSRHPSGSLRMGHGCCQKAGLGENDSEYHPYRRACARGASSRLPRN